MWYLITWWVIGLVCILMCIRSSLVEDIFTSISLEPPIRARLATAMLPFIGIPLTLGLAFLWIVERIDESF